MAATCIETMGSQPPKCKGLFKNTAVSVWAAGGNQKIHIKANKEQAQKMSKAVKPLLLKIMTEIYDRFLPRQKGAQLEG